eukprot:NODE_752_length_4544_cov_0.307312.p1 type:complete len:295 gc:universal NODE_752_length_4544_cov_0.307312:2674-1790(-)
MLIYNPYYYAFAYGLGFVISFASFMVDFGSICLFGSGKLQRFMILMDSALLVTCSTAGFVPRTTGFWIAMIFMKTLYVMCFSMYSFLRFHAFISKRVRLFSYIGYICITLSFLVFEFSCYGFIPTYYGLYAVFLTLPLAFLITNFVSYRIIKIINKNQLARYSLKETRLSRIAYMTILLQNVVAIPSMTLVLLGNFMQNGMFLALAYAIIPLISLGYSVSNCLIMLNKYMEDEMHCTYATKMRFASDLNRDPPVVRSFEVYSNMHIATPLPETRHSYPLHTVLYKSYGCSSSFQ